MNRRERAVLRLLVWSALLFAAAALAAGLRHTIPWLAISLGIAAVPLAWLTWEEATYIQDALRDAQARDSVPERLTIFGGEVEIDNFRVRRFGRHYPVPEWTIVTADGGRRPVPGGVPLLAPGERLVRVLSWCDEAIGECPHVPSLIGAGESDRQRGLRSRSSGGEFATPFGPETCGQ